MLNYLCGFIYIPLYNSTHLPSIERHSQSVIRTRNVWHEKKESSFHILLKKMRCPPWFFTFIFLLDFPFYLSFLDFYISGFLNEHGQVPLLRFSCPFGLSPIALRECSALDYGLFLELFMRGLPIRQVYLL